MITRILIIGGYGNFGSFIALRLSREDNIQLIIAGRDKHKAEKYADKLQAKLKPESYQLDIDANLEEALISINPHVVIHTSGPYQNQSYKVAEACIKQGCHYIDLADGRAFVNGITCLDQQAQAKKVLLVSGASSVPCLTAAIIDKYKTEFNQLEKIEYAIATAHLTNRGLATTTAALSYAGKPFTTLIDGQMQTVYGWTDLKFRRFWKLGLRPMSHCDIPDLTLFPARYPTVNTIHFRGGIEIKLLHIILVGLSWLVRFNLISSLEPYAAKMLKISFLFDVIGRDNSGFYMSLFGLDESGKNKQIDFEIVAKKGDGLYIPSMPSIVIAKKIANNELTQIGAKPCLDIITLDEYLQALQDLHIEWRVTVK